MPTAGLSNTSSMEDLNLVMIINNASLCIKSERSCCHSAVTLWAATIMAHNNNKALSLLWNSPVGHMHLFQSSRNIFLQLISPVISCISQKQGGGRTTKLGGVKIAFRLWDALFCLSIQKGGVRGAEAGNHPKGQGWGGGGMLRNKVQVTS